MCKPMLIVSFQMLIGQLEYAYVLNVLKCKKLLI